MIAKFDDFNRLEQPSLVLTNPEEIPISYIDEHYIKNFIFKPKFNDISEITFDIYEHSLNGEIFKGYRKLIQRMRIAVEGYGSWIISEVLEKKSNVGDANYKSITLKSTEYEIQNIQIPYIDGTYKLYDIAEYEKSLLGTTLSKIPKWTIEHVDSTIASLYRTFEVPDSNVLSFLLNDVQDAYGCLFIFDCAKRKISVYDRDTYVRYSGILLTNDELIDSMEITRSDENLITALSVFGDSDLGINAVNPLGTSSIYNFSQVKQWMTPELLTKVNTWEKEVSNAEGTVKNKNIELSKLNAELTSINTHVSSQEQTVKGLKAERDVIVSKNNQTELDSINSQISTAESQLSTYKTNQTNKQNQITQKQNELSTIQTKLSPANYFGDLYYNFLSYVYENEYTNDNITVTDSMTYEERINEIQTLYDAAKDVLLQKVNIPNEYSVDTKGFVFNKKFINHTHGLEVGSLIGAETEGLNDGKIEYFPVLEFEVNYEDKSVKITFGNKFNSARAKDLFADLMHNVSSTGKILDYIAAKKADTSEISDMQKFINSTLDLSKNAILSANGQTVEITDSGYHGRRLLPDGSLDKEELAVINNTIAFTRDNWNTCSLALGKLTLPNGNNVYGIIAEALIGTLVMGEKLYISNAQNTFTIDENGLTITNGTNTFVVNPNDDKLLRLFKEDKDIFYVDKNGLLHLSGDGAGLDISSNNEITGIKQNLIAMDGKFETSISDLNHKSSTISQEIDKMSISITDSYNNAISNAKSYTDSSFKIVNDTIVLNTSSVCTSWDVSGYWHDINYKGYGEPTEDKYPIAEYRGKTYLDVSNGYVYYCCNDDGSYEHWFRDNNYICPRATITQESQIKQAADSIKLKVGVDNIISSINLTKDSATIEASKINLNGIVTANDRFKINLDGSMEATDGRFSGTIEGSHIKSGYIDGTNMFFSMATVDPNNPKSDGQGGIVCTFDKENWSSLDVFGIDELILSTTRSVDEGGKVSVDRVFNAKRGITLSADTSDTDNYGWLDWYNINEHIGSIFANNDSFVIQSMGGKNLCLNSVTNGSGNINYYGNLIQNSSIRYKRNVKDITQEYAAKILELEPVEYDYIDSSKHSLGLIAEDVVKIIPQIVMIDKEGRPDGISYIELIPLIIKQLQILNNKIKEK